MTELSPQAQAVLDAFKDQVELTWLTKDPERVGLAAALRAAAEELQYKLFLPGNDLRIVESRALFKLADELEGFQ
jgi:hypothetical protein